MSNSTVKGAKELAQKLAALSSKAETNLEKALLKGAIAIESDAKRKCAVDTGYLRASITHQFYKNGLQPFALAGTNTEYAGYVENGTSKQPAQPYLRPAFEENIDTIRQNLREAKWQ